MSEALVNQKSALVTGAGRGIGRAIALALARRGYRLCLAARTFAELEETRRLSGLQPADCLIVLLDLAEPDAPANLIETVISHFGRLDLLVNNAGWAPPRRMLSKLSEAEQDRILAVNLRAPIALTRLAAPHMIERNAGVIVNVASLAARTMAPGEAVYAAAKAGVVAFTHACFAELRENGIKLSVVVPGLVDTALIPPNKRLDRSLMLSSEQVTAAVLQVIESEPGACPVEMVIVPQRNPEVTRRPLQSGPKE